MRRGAALAAYDDFAYVAATTLLFLGLLRIPRSSEPAQRVVWSTSVALVALPLLFTLANVRIVPMLGRPLSYYWLYYSDFLDSQDVRNAVGAELLVPQRRRPQYRQSEPG